jgi:hypothetical protein
MHLLKGSAGHPRPPGGTLAPLGSIPEQRTGPPREDVTRRTRRPSLCSRPTSNVAATLVVDRSAVGSTAQQCREATDERDDGTGE